MALAGAAAVTRTATATASEGRWRIPAGTHGAEKRSRTARRRGQLGIEGGVEDKAHVRVCADLRARFTAGAAAVEESRGATDDGAKHSAARAHRADAADLTPVG